MKDSNIKNIIRFFYDSYNDSEKGTIKLDEYTKDTFSKNRKRNWVPATDQNIHIGDTVKIKRTNITGIVTTTPVKTLGISNQSIKFKRSVTTQEWSELWEDISPWRNLKNIKVLKK